MIPSVGDILRSLGDPHTAFERLEDIEPLGLQPMRTTLFTEFAVRWRGSRWLLCTPAAEGAADAVERIAARLRGTSSRFMTEYLLYRSELRYTDSSGCNRLCDILMHRLPAGIPLASLSGIDSRQRLLAETDDMQREFAAAGFSHNNLKPTNIIVTPDERLVALRYHMASFGAATTADAEAFDSLRRLISELPENGSDPMTACDAEPAQYSAVRFDEGCRPESRECEQMILISRNGLFGYADPSGRTVVEPCFCEASDFREGRAEVRTKEGAGLIDKSGRYVISPRFEYVEYRDDCGITLARLEGTWTAFDYEGRPTGLRNADVAALCEALSLKLNKKIEL